MFVLPWVAYRSCRFWGIDKRGRDGQGLGYKKFVSIMLKKMPR